MSRRHRWAAVASALALLAAYGATGFQHAQADSSQVVSDPAGDATTRVDPDTGATTTIPNEPRADIVSASASYASGSIVLSVRTAQPVDLRTANIDADNTTMQWAIDVNNDGKSDYQVEYGVDTGKLYAEVYLPNATTKSCTGTASIAADGSYVSSVPLNCLGNPQSFRWGGLMQFTATGTPPAPTDRVPDAGYLGPISAAASTPPPTTPGTTPGGGGGAPLPTTTTTAPRPIVAAPVASNQGFWLLGRDGGVFSFGTAPFYGSVGNIPLNRQIVAMAAKPDSTGYWFVDSTGEIYVYKAPFWGSTANVALTKPIVGMAPTPSGQGYWLVASDGGIFAFGDAHFFGSTGSINLNKPIVGMAATPSGKGYWLVASDGGIFAFGDAPFYGSTGSLTLNQPIVGMAPSPTGKGYWFVASDGGIFAFGDAPFLGSAVSDNPVPVVGMAPTKNVYGYRVVRADGSVAPFGGAAAGSGLTGSLAAPVVGIVTAF